MTGRGGPRTTTDHAVLVLLAIVWFALAAGLGEAAVLLVRRFVFHRFTWSSVDVVWMAPVSNVAFLIVPAFILSLLAALRPRWVPLPLLGAVLALFTTAALVEVAANGALATWAIAMLALGVGIRLGSRLQGGSDGFVRLLRHTTPALAGLVVLLALAVPGWRILRERQAMGRIAPSDRPNVLLVILDTVRAASLGLYGYSRPTTPNLERWAERGVVFDEALAPAPWTLPSHGTMFTGHWPSELSARWHVPLDDEFPTLAEALRDGGYVTAGFVANPYYTTRESGLSRGFVHYEALPTNAIQILRSSLLGQVVEGMVFRRRYHYDPERTTHRRRAAEVRQSFLAWLPKADGRPWFAFLNLFDAHKPYNPPEPFASRLTGADQEVDRYDQNILYMDHELGLLFDDLERRGLLDNTLVIVASDHGEQFGGHTLFGHGNGLYRRVIHVPLVIRWPGLVPEGVRVARPVTLRDLAPTILDLIGAPRGSFEGTPLRQAWLPDGIYAETIFSEVEEALDRPGAPASLGPMQSLMADHMHYIRRGDGHEQLFDLRTDPQEYTNLADSASRLAVLKRFRETLPSFYPPAARKLARTDSTPEADTR